MVATQRHTVADNGHSPHNCRNHARRRISDGHCSRRFVERSGREFWARPGSMVPRVWYILHASRTNGSRIYKEGGGSSSPVARLRLADNVGCRMHRRSPFGLLAHPPAGLHYHNGKTEELTPLIPYNPSVRRKKDSASA